MHIHSAPGSSWSTKIPYIPVLSALAFGAGSIVLNIGYAASSKPDLLSQVVWGAAAAGASLGFTFAMPAFLRACAARQLAPGCMCAMALIVFGMWSCVSALGNAGGARSAASATERTYLETRQRAQAAFDEAKAALAKLGPSRPLAEIAAVVDSTKARCRDGVCTKPAALLAELGRAKEYQRLQDAIDKASATLATAPARPANSDSVAISGFLAVLGANVSPDRVNGWLVLLSVVLLECGAGLSLAIREGLMIAVAPAPTRPSGRSDQATEQPASRPAATVQTVMATPASAIEEALRAAGGSLDSLRALAERLGRPKSSVAVECHRLASAGAVRLAKRGRGTRIELATRAN